MVFAGGRGVSYLFWNSNRIEIMDAPTRIIKMETSLKCQENVSSHFYTIAMRPAYLRESVLKKTKEA